MRRMVRMLLIMQFWSFAAFGAAAHAADEGGPEPDAAAPAEWNMADAELAVLNYLVAALRADAWTAHADAMARMHAEAAVLARFGLAPPEEAAGLEGLKASAVSEREAANAALEAARAELAERLLSAALRTMSERAASARPAGAESAEAAGSGDEAASAGEAAGNAAASAGAGENGADGDAAAYPEPLLAAERAMRQACRQADAAALLRKAGVGSAAVLADARFACLQAELAWIDAQAANLAALLAGSPESDAKPAGLPALFGLVRERQPALYDRWMRRLAADASCPSGAPPAAAAAVRVDGAEGVKAERLNGCAVGLPGILPASPQTSLRIDPGGVYVPLRPYASALGLGMDWNAAERRVTLAAGETRLWIRPGSADIEWDGGGSVGMSAPVLSVNGSIHVPAEFFDIVFGLALYQEDNVRAGWLLPSSV